MKIHYYLDWFYDRGFPEKLINVLREDITDRKSLVMISADKGEQVSIDDVFERTWFNQADIFFNEYHFIDHRTQKEDAQRLIQNASVIFLCGGDPRSQKNLLTENELSDLIKKSNAVVMGTSAGSENMGAKWVCSKNFGYEVETSTIYEGMALNHFSFVAHFDLENTALIEDDFFPLSEKTDIYMADKDGAVRVKNDKIDIIGNVFLITHSKIQKIDKTFN